MKKPTQPPLPRWQQIVSLPQEQLITDIYTGKQYTSYQLEHVDGEDDYLHDLRTGDEVYIPFLRLPGEETKLKTGVYKPKEVQYRYGKPVKVSWGDLK